LEEKKPLFFSFLSFSFSFFFLFLSLSLAFNQMATLLGLLVEFINKLTEYALTNHRALFVVFFLLPLSFLFDIAWYIRNKYTFLMGISHKEHDARALGVQKQVRQWIAEGSKAQMCSARPGWLTMSFRIAKYKKTMKTIQINLHDILSVDAKRKVVRLEPMVTMGQLTAALLSKGWTLPVVPEMDDLTVGGLIMGFGVEGSSHKYGLFQHICESFEMVMADGSLIRCSKTENPKLFYNIPWSHGTLGFLVAAELKIMPAKKYVRVKYTPCCSRNEIIETFERAALEEKCDFLECIMYSDQTAVVMEGYLDDRSKWARVNPIGNFYKPWFFKHVHTYLETHKIGEEYIPLRHYYHRHTRAIFWELQDIVPFGNNIVFRFLLGWLMPPKVALLKLTQTKATRKLYDAHHAVQDLLVPLKCLNDALDCLHHELDIYPLWICPMKIIKTPIPGLVNPSNDKDEMYVDIGAYGNPKSPSYSAKNSMRKIEKFVRDVKGYQALYADTFMTKEEFREMFDHTTYDEIRKDFKADKAFPEIYDKVCKAARI